LSLTSSDISFISFKYLTALLKRKVSELAPYQLRRNPNPVPFETTG
jgi:hypothetical protein